MIKLMKRILAVSGPYKRRIQWAFLFAFLHALLAKAPIGMSFLALIAFSQGTMTGRLCLYLGFGLAGCILLQCLFQNISDRLQAAAGYLVFADMRLDLGRHLRKMPMGYFTEGSIGKISSVLSTDMVFIEENCMHDIADMMSYVFAQIIMVAFLLAVSPWLGLTAAVIVLAIWLLGQRALKSTLAHSALRQAQSEAMTEAVLDFTEGIGIIKTYNLLGDKSKELSESFAKTCRVNLDFEESEVPWQRILQLCCALGALVILTLTLWLYGQGTLAGAMAIGVLLFVFELFGPIKALFSQSTRLTVMNACLDRVEEIFAQVELPDVGKTAIPAESDAPEVEFRNVRFAYGDQDVLRDVSFQVNRNQMAALVGPSGGGKSTLASLLTRFWDVKAGQVLVRGTDIREVPLADLMDHISMVFQRVYLFQDTIYNNISMGRPDATREEVMEAARKARCYDFIMQLPDGFDTVVGEGGATLSGGEKQRISIARCILKDAPIIILDEATASVDADNESYIQQAISELVQGKTLLVIAHRLNTIRGADQILVISDGEIAQRGTHQSLMEEDGIYRNFVTVRQQSRGWNRQAGA